MNFIPFPELNTNRLFFKQLKLTDNNEILFLRSDDIVNEFIKRPKPKDIEDANKFINKINKGIEDNELLFWGISMKNQSNIIGTICLWNFTKDGKTAEVGYDLNPEYQHQGIMSEALKGVIDFGFNTLKLVQIEAFTNKNNENSLKLLKKHYFKIAEDRKDENNFDNIIFELKNKA